MHKIAAKEFTLEDFSHEHLMDELDFERTFKTYLLMTIGLEWESVRNIIINVFEKTDVDIVICKL